MTNANINPYKMKKVDLLRFFTKRCRHGHFYHEHPACFIKEEQYYPKIGILDIETTGLAGGDFDLVLCYAIKVYGEAKTLTSIMSQEEFNTPRTDKKLIQRCIKDILKFDKLVTYNGIWFDVPFLRARALSHKLKNFPPYGLIHHTDVYQIAKHTLRMPRRTMHNVLDLVRIKGKNHVKPKIWNKAKFHCDPDAMTYILDHCVRDVAKTEQLYDLLKPYSRETRRSI